MPSSSTAEDWRAAVLGGDKIVLHMDETGRPLFNGHRVTRLMCEAIRFERPDHAQDFVYENIVAMARRMRPPEVLEPGTTRP
ncbi:hypothetical protein [Streptomyces melanogenes]|uniref:hypothetical protein n=1 Tax=Streptomyces melanogenes TaxID=67326 RepID=UPI00167CAB14|nr:hypothetical protein [Streptomyces melanogenes]